MSLPHSDTRKAWETFTSIIKHDSVIKREFKTLIIWDGSKQDIQNPITGNLPYLRLSPHPSHARTDKQDWTDTQGRDADIYVDVLVAMPGTNVSDMFDAWDALTRAVFPKDPDKFAAVDKRLRDAGIFLVEMPLPGDAVLEKDDGSGIRLQSTGICRLGFYQQLRF